MPDELIRAVTEGSATFLCGAGVSFRAKLPSFKKLTEQVYARLGESADGEPAERSAIASKEYDRALRSLEKRTHRPGTPSRVRDAVAALLAAPAVAFPDHLALLKLSRDSDGRPRLLTTNFDTLFERAASAAPRKRRKPRSPFVRRFPSPRRKPSIGYRQIWAPRSAPIYSRPGGGHWREQIIREFHAEISRHQRCLGRTVDSDCRIHIGLGSSESL
jgi:hypothetical protein